MTAFVVAATLFAERQPFDRYQSIVDRQMFGVPPPGFDPTRPPSEVSRSDARAEEEQLTKEQEQIKSAIHFSMINVTPSGETAVGFTDSGTDPKNPSHYYLKVGESRNGWTVKEADPVKATMTIVKDEVEVSLKIGDNSAQGGKNGGKGAPPAAAAAGGLRGGLLGGASLRDRRMLREQQRREDAAAAAARKAEEEKRREEERAEAEEEKARLAQEREEQRAQLQQIQEVLRKEREERMAREAEEKNNEEGGESE